MAWVAGADVSTGELITAAQWNNYLGASGSIEYLKTEADRIDDISHDEPSRALTTIYHNTSSKVLAVLVSMNEQSGGTSYIYSDANASPSDLIARFTGSVTASSIIPIFFLVPPGYYYKIISAAGSITEWHEWALH